MKEKKGTKALYILGFLGSLFFAVFILLEFRKDYFAVAEVGFVMLIQAYLLVNKIQEDVYKKYELDKEDINEKFDSLAYKMDEKCDRIEQIQRAIYVASKKGSQSVEHRLEIMENKINQLEIEEDRRKEDL